MGATEVTEEKDRSLLGRESPRKRREASRTNKIHHARKHILTESSELSGGERENPNYTLEGPDSVD